MDLFKLGKDKDSGKIVEVSEVKSGLDCNCVCPNCGKDLVAAQGEKTEWYFRHYEQASDCKTGPEKGIQELAKEILITNSRIKTPSLGTIKYSHATTEKKSDLKPDVSAEINGNPLFFNIKINKENKLNSEVYKDKKIKSILIDLSDYVYTSKDQFRKDLLNNASNKEIIYWQEENSLKNTGKLALGLLGAGLALGVLALTSTREKPEEKHSSTALDFLENYKDLFDKSKDKLEKRKAELKDISKT